MDLIWLLSCVCYLTLLGFCNSGRFLDVWFYENGRFLDVLVTQDNFTNTRQVAYITYVCSVITTK